MSMVFNPTARERARIKRFGYRPSLKLTARECREYRRQRRRALARGLREFRRGASFAVPASDYLDGYGPPRSYPVSGRSGRFRAAVWYPRPRLVA